MRWVFALFNLGSLTMLVALLAGRAVAGRPADLAVAVALVALAAKYRAELRGRNWGAAGDLAEAVVLMGAGVAADSPLVIVLLLYARIASRALDVSGRDAALVMGWFLAAFAGAIALSSPLARSGDSIIELIFLGSGFPLAALVMHSLGSALKQLTRGQAREAMLRRGTSAVALAGDREGVCLAAVAAARNLVETHGEAIACLALGPPDDMVAIVVDPGQAGPPRALRRPLAPLSNRLRSSLSDGRPVRLTAGEAQALWPPEFGVAACVEAVSLRVARAGAGTLLVGTASPLGSESEDALATLGTEVALALDGITLNEELHLRRSEERLNSLIQHSSDIITVVDGSGQVRYASPAVAALLGQLADGIAGTRLVEWVHPDDAARIEAALNVILTQPGVGSPVEFRLRGSDGSWHNVEAVGNNLLDRPDIGGVVITIRDITERRRAEDELRNSERNFRLLFEANPQPMWVYDAETLVFLSVNDAAIVKYGYSRDDFLRMRVTDIRPEEEIPSFLAFLGDDNDRQRASDRVRVSEGWHHRLKDGRIIDVDVLSHRQEFAGRPAVLTMAQDVTARRALEEQLRHQAFHDSLTGLPNRALLADRADHALARARRGGPQPVMLVVDLDGFKIVNDNLGHAAGDQLIAAVAARLAAGLRGGDTAARLGGDEFAVMLESVESVEAAAEVAQRIQHLLSRPFTVEGGEVTVTASIGIAPGRPDHLAMDELLREADIAMYVAKGRGPGSHVVFQAVHHAARLDRIRLRQELREALAQEQLYVVYQPQIDLRSGRVTAVEALARWQHSTRGAVAPDEFVPVAEQSGLIGLLDGWVLRTACQQLRDWTDAGHPPLRVAVNISGSDLERPDLVDHIARVLEETQLDPWRLELELTEGAAMSQQEDAAARLHRLRALGVRIAIDDFGTGYSMLSRLRDLPVDKLKLDKSFISDLGRDDDVTRIVRSAIDMGHGLGLTVVAEGVETERTLRLIKELGCDGAQGFLIAHPLPADELPRWLRESPWAALPSLPAAATPRVQPRG